MGQHEDKIAILRKYYKDIPAGAFDFYIAGDIKSKKINNAISSFAQGVDRSTIIGFYDLTVMGGGKNGYLFTDTKLYYREPLEKPGKIWYEDIKDIKVSALGAWIDLTMFDGSNINMDSSFINFEALYNFFKEILEYNKVNKSGSDESVSYRSVKNPGAVAGGLALGSYGTVNKLYDEEKFHAQQRHGFAAERANTLYDKFTGHDAKIVGDDNIKNGADRIVDGAYIQSKYCQSGRACINECFDKDGQFRYMHDGKPMQIEVPKDKWDAAVEAMQKKIKNGEVSGVTDPNEAKNIVRQGHFTYEQAKNIAKAGTVESLAYDSVNGVIIAGTALGVTAVITLATNIWNGEDFDKSLKIATYSGIKVGGTAFITTIVTSQLSKAGLNSALVGSSEAMVAVMGPKASAVLVNAFRSGSNIYGAAAMKSAAKLLRGNVITAGVTVVVLSSFDIANIFRGRISGKQLFKNLTSTGATVAGGTGGWLGGAAIGSALFPGVGTVIGGLVGTVVAGAAAGKVVDTVVGSFVEDDADEMVRIIQQEFGNLAQDYLLNQKEGEKVADRLKEKLDGKKLQDMFASSDRRAYARNLLIPMIEDEVKNRKKIAAVSNDRIAKSMRYILEKIADNPNPEDMEKIFV